MATSALARRYATAVFDLAVKAGAVEPRAAELREAQTALSPSVIERLDDPRVPVLERVAAVQGLLGGAGVETQNLVRLLVERHRVALLPGIVEEFDRLRDQAAGVVRAEVTTAVPVDDALRTTITAELGRRLGTEVTTVVRQDPAILGGLVIRIGDRVVDASLRTKLQKLQAALA